MKPYFAILAIIFILVCIILITPALFLINPELTPLTESITAIFRIICHQQPERSYYIYGHQLPVCARCTGIYTGLLTGCLLYPLFKRVSSIKIPDIKYLVLFLVPFLFDGIMQTFHIYQTSNITRTIIGIWGFIAIPFYAIPSINRIFYRE